MADNNNGGAARQTQQAGDNGRQNQFVARGRGHAGRRPGPYDRPRRGGRRGGRGAHRGGHTVGFQDRHEAATTMERDGHMHHVKQITLQSQRTGDSHMVSMASWNSSRGGGSTTNIQSHLGGITEGGGTVFDCDNEAALLRAYREQVAKGGRARVAGIMFTPVPAFVSEDGDSTLEVEILQLNPRSHHSTREREAFEERKREFLGRQANTRDDAHGRE